MKIFCILTILLLAPLAVSAAHVSPPEQITPVVTATLEGLHALHANRDVDARVLFTLEGDRFAAEIFPQDFDVWGLPGGLFAEEAERLSDTVVSVQISGFPRYATTGVRTLGVSPDIPARNFHRSNFSVRVVREDLTFGDVAASADVSPRNITFDLNRNGRDHRDVFVTLSPRGYELRGLRFGIADLVEDEDFFRDSANRFRLRTEFLERLPIGRWDLTFRMSEGGNPTVSMNIIDTTREYFIPPTPAAPGLAPGLPPAPPRADENFMYLSGGLAVSIDELRWDLGRARVAPVVQNGAATLTLRTHALENMGLTRPGSHFEIVTPMARLSLPTNLLDTTLGARAAIVARALAYSEVDMRITLADVSANAGLTTLFTTFHPYGEILTPLVDVRVELLNAATGEVFFTADEFTRPLDMSFVVMNNAAHLRPAGVFFQPSWLEFVPYRNFTPNEFTTRSIFAGTHAMIHNRMHFEDVNQVHWGFAQAYTAAYSGLLFPVAELQPDAHITRGEFAQLVASALQLPRATASNSGFVDILAPSVFFDGVSRLFEAGLLGPYTPGASFRPTQIISREEIAAITGTAILRGTPVRAEIPRPLDIAFTDARFFTLQHRHPVQIAVNHGIMTGYPDHTFRPQANATRLYALDATIELARVLGLLDDGI